MYNQSFKCYDSRGKELKYVYQWDTNRKIKFIFNMYWSPDCRDAVRARQRGDNVNIPSESNSTKKPIIPVNLYAHFCNHRMNKTLNVECSVVEGETSIYECTIPNVLLTQPDDIEIYIYEKMYQALNDKRTLAKVVIPIVQRPMPDEYIYRDDVPIADDLSLEDGVLSLSQNGVSFGTTVTIPE